MEQNAWPEKKKKKTGSLNRLFLYTFAISALRRYYVFNTSTYWIGWLPVTPKRYNSQNVAAFIERSSYGRS